MKFYKKNKDFFSDEVSFGTIYCLCCLLDAIIVLLGMAHCKGYSQVIGRAKSEKGEGSQCRLID